MAEPKTNNDGRVGSIVELAVHTVKGSAGGSLQWMQLRGRDYREILIVLSGYNNSGTTEIDFDVPFNFGCGIVDNATTMTLPDPGLKSFVLPATGGAQDGVISIKGL
jgi:hypothetical protein